jgi:lysophospholipase L1-like esterase
MPRPRGRVALGTAASGLLLLLGLLAAATAGANRPGRPYAVLARARAATIWPSPVRSGRAAIVQLGDGRAASAAGLVACLTPPGGRSRCRSVARRRTAGGGGGGGGVTVRLRLGRVGRWLIELRAAGPRPLPAGAFDLRRTVTVSGRPLRLLATGDSEIQGLDDLLAGGLPGVRVTSEAHISTGISKPRMFDWVARARVQARSLHPDITVVYLGANDGFGLPTASGGYANCCGADWVRAFAARARSMMASYGRGGDGRVFWLTLPAPSNQAAAPIFRAINRAYALAARALPRGEVRLIDLGAVFTPGGHYRSSMFYAGREQTVREPDGYHLSAAGNRIAASIVTADMRADGLVG